MQRSDFYFDLPPELIAQYPPAERGASRLLLVNPPSTQFSDLQFADFIDLVQPNDLLVFNDTRVIPARLFGHKASGGRVEILIERLQEHGRVLAHVRASKSPKAGARITLEGGLELAVLGREDDLFQLQFLSDQPLLSLLERYGHIPLPPYISRSDEAQDSERYQTVYARQPGAVAAPTAGLHFSPALLEQLEQRGVQRCFVTLHVGAGTFRPVRVDDIQQHQMHQEWFAVEHSVCEAVAATRARGGRVIAVGTTAVRALESAAASGQLQAGCGETRIFIYPGYQFRVVDALLTNFHLPESTLLMLVSALAGYETVMAAYQHAVTQRYRFFSYGDAMFLNHRI